MGANMYAKKGNIEIGLGRVGFDYETLIVNDIMDGGDRVLTYKQLEGMSAELEREIDKIEKSIAILIAYCPNKKNDLSDKINEYNDWIEDLKSNIYRRSNLNLAMDLMMHEGFEVGISY